MCGSRQQHDCAGVLLPLRRPKVVVSRPSGRTGWITAASFSPFLNEGEAFGSSCVHQYRLLLGYALFLHHGSGKHRSRLACTNIKSRSPDEGGPGLRLCPHGRGNPYPQLRCDPAIRHLLPSYFVDFRRIRQQHSARIVDQQAGLFHGTFRKQWQPILRNSDIPETHG